MDTVTHLSNLRYAWKVELSKFNYWKKSFSHFVLKSFLFLFIVFFFKFIIFLQLEFKYVQINVLKIVSILILSHFKNFVSVSSLTRQKKTHRLKNNNLATPDFTRQPLRDPFQIPFWPMNQSYRRPHVCSVDSGWFLAGVAPTFDLTVTVTVISILLWRRRHSLWETWGLFVGHLVVVVWGSQVPHLQMLSSWEFVGFEH